MEIKPQPKRNGFATFSLVLAIAALASTLTMTIVIPIFLAILNACTFRVLLRYSNIFYGKIQVFEKKC